MPLPPDIAHALLADQLDATCRERFGRPADRVPFSRLVDAAHPEPDAFRATPAWVALDALCRRVAGRGPDFVTPRELRIAQRIDDQLARHQRAHLHPTRQEHL